jgi:hypothetical protein
MQSNRLQEAICRGPDHRYDPYPKLLERSDGNSQAFPRHYTMASRSQLRFCCQGMSRSTQVQRKSCTRLDKGSVDRLHSGFPYRTSQP